MKNFETKNINGGVIDVSTSSRKVKVAFSEVDSKDLDNDVIDNGAYNKTVQERGPKGSNLIWHLTDHCASLKSAVGKPNEIYMENQKLVSITDIPKTTWGNDVLEHYQVGNINQHSIGFRTIKNEPINAGKPDEYNLIKEVLLYEGSAVLWGANENTPTLSVGKSLTKEEIMSEYSKTIDELNKFHKMFRNGHFTDDTFELIEIKISQLTSKLQQLFTSATLPAVKAVEPENNGLLDVLKTFNNKLKGETNGHERNSIAA